MVVILVVGVGGGGGGGRLLLVYVLFSSRSSSFSTWYFFVVHLFFREHDVFERAVKPAFPKRDDTVATTARKCASICSKRRAIYRTLVRFERPRAALVSKIPNFRRAVRGGRRQKVSSRVPLHVRYRISM